MRPFRERNPEVIGVIGFVVIAVMMLSAFRAAVCRLSEVATHTTPNSLLLAR